MVRHRPPMSFLSKLVQHTCVAPPPPAIRQHLSVPSTAIAREHRRKQEKEIMLVVCASSIYMYMYNHTRKTDLMHIAQEPQHSNWNISPEILGQGKKYYSTVNTIAKKLQTFTRTQARENLHQGLQDNSNLCSSFALSTY